MALETRGRAATVLQEGAPVAWRHVRATDLLDAAALKKLLDPRLLKKFSAGSTIVPQDAVREVAIQLLWKGTAKAVRVSPGKPETFFGFVNEGSIFGETAYLQEAHAGSSVVAVTECVIYNLPGPWLDGLFEMDRLLGGQFFELVCLVLLERSVLQEELVFNDNVKGKEEVEDDDDLEGL